MENTISIAQQAYMSQYVPKLNEKKKEKKREPADIVKAPEKPEHATDSHVDVEA